MSRNWMAVLTIAGVLALATSAHANDAKAQFAAADRNGDGSLDRTEFRVFMKSQAASGNGAAKTVTVLRVYGLAFRRIDKNSDGLVSQRELAAAAGTQVPKGG